MVSVCFFNKKVPRSIPDIFKAYFRNWGSLCLDVILCEHNISSVLSQYVVSMYAKILVTGYSGCTNEMFTT